MPPKRKAVAAKEASTKTSKRSTKSKDESAAAVAVPAPADDNDDKQSGEGSLAFDATDPQMAALEAAARMHTINEKLVAGPRAVALWLRSHTVDAKQARSFKRTAPPTEFWCTHVTPAAAEELSALLKRVRLIRTRLFDRIVCGNQDVTSLSLVCALDVAATGLAASPHSSAFEARRAGELVVSFEHESVSRSDVGFFTMTFADGEGDQSHVLDWSWPAFDNDPVVFDAANANALCEKLSIQHASSMQLVCFFSVLAAAALPWRTALGETDFGCAKGCWLFPGNLCHALNMPK